MKKLILVVIVLFVTTLAACGGSQDAKEVYKKAVEAGEKVESAEVDMAISQTMAGDPTMGEIVMNTDMQASMIMEPLSMHQKGNMQMEMQGMPIDTEVEMYMTDEGVYMYDSMSQTWMKFDSSMMPTELANLDQGPTEQLDVLESFVDQVEFSEEDDAYVYKFEGEGDEIKEFTKQLVEGNLGEDTFVEFGADMNQVLEDMTIHSIYYELHIDKESYDTKKVITNLDLEIAADAEGNTMRIEQEMTADYTGINTIDVIEVPQEVIDSAQEI